MSNELTVIEQRPLTANEIKANVQLIQQVMEAVMIKDTHYGTIPGTNKPTLYKAGAEKILATFKIGVEPLVIDLSTADEAKFRVMARGFMIADGRMVGQGVGEASSNEEKYKWRAAVCVEEYDATPEDRRRDKFQRDGKTIKQVRTNPSDVANTVLKMAKKRAQIDLTLTATAASDVFAQDLEDLPEGMVQEGEKRAPIAMPKEKASPAEPPKANESQEQANGNTVKGTIEKVSVKNGEKDGKPWTKFGVKLGDDWYGTFDTDHGKIAHDAKENGQQVEIEWAQSGNFLNLVGIRVLAE